MLLPQTIDQFKQPPPQDLNMDGEDPATCPPSPFSRRSFFSSEAVSSPRRLSTSSSSSSAQIALAKLEDEFRNILLTKSNDIELNTLIDLTTSLSMDRRSCDGDRSEDEESSLIETGGDSSSTSRRSLSRQSMNQIDIFSSDCVLELRSIVDQMISNGHAREIAHVYSSVRKSAVDSTFKHLGIEKLSIGDVQKLDWPVLENKIRRWIRAAKVCVRIVFPSESSLCDSIFDAATDDDENNVNNTNVVNPFFDTVKAAALQLFGFPDAISIGKRSPEKLFKILDLHEAISELMPDVSEIFGPESSIYTHVSDILTRLTEAVRGILSEFENAVLKEPSKIPVPGGTVHPLTRYVMNYISLISDYKQTLVELIVTKPSGHARLTVDDCSGDDGVVEIEFPESENQSPLSSHLIWIIAILQFNLENKGNLYKDSSLGHLFLMNNVHYIVNKVKGSSELREFIGDDYLRKMMGKFRQSATSYQRATWVRVLNCLREEGIHVSGSFSSGVSKSALRERFKSFNALFDETHRVQATWFVPDMQLREELRISIAEKLLPAYRSFLGRFRHHIESGRHPEMYIKYSVEDLENALADFFEGCQHIPISRRRSH